jgi:hypothetical protein
MREIPIGTLQNELDNGIRGRLCVQAWLGYGEVLFLGFGDEVIPPVSPAESHPVPLYELQSNLADWRVEERSVVRGTLDDPWEQAQEACQLLVGKRALGWNLDTTTLGLTVYFESDLSLKVIPWAEEEHHGKTAWMFVNAEDEYLIVTPDGRLRVDSGDEGGNSRASPGPDTGPCTGR